MCWDSTVDTIHRDDIKVLGLSPYAINYIAIDWQAVERRAAEEIRRNIEAKKSPVVY